MISRNYLKINEANKNKNKNRYRFKFQSQSEILQRWFGLDLDWVGETFSTREPGSYR